MLQQMNEKPRANASDGSVSPPPRLSARALEDMAAGFAALSALGHERLTVRQSLVFLAVAHAHAMGRSITLTDIRHRYAGTGALGDAIIKSFAMFLPPTKRLPEALGWIVQEEDENDRRFKYLRLTEKGQHVAATVIEALKG